MLTKKCWSGLKQLMTTQDKRTTTHNSTYPQVAVQWLNQASCLLSNYFGNSVRFWLGLQDDYDVEEEMSKKAKEFKAIKQYKINAA